MFKRKHDFKPDRMGVGFLNKLYITRRQRLTLLRYLLLGLALLLLSLLQDVILCRVSIGGATTDLVSGGILLLSILLPTDAAAVTALIASVLYFFSGSAAGAYSIVLLTGLGVLGNIFRRSYLRRGFGSSLFCAGTGILVYELAVFVMGLFLGSTTTARFGTFCLTAGLTLALMPLMYPIFHAIGKIGGDSSWKE